LVGALTRSAKAPRVTIDPVRPGQQGDTVRVRWRAQDLDGDPLLTTVQYRTSPKEQWQTVALDVEADAVDIPSLALSGSRTGQFRVVTSDGLSFAQAISPVVALPDHDIEPGFFGLVGDAESFPLVGAQNLTLEAFAYDIEDGNISDKITWRLGRKTLVGDGESFPIFADSLPEGSHLGTLSVTDSAGHTKTTQFKVIVYRVKDWGSQQG
jgi:hypothetical protein